MAQAEGWGARPGSPWGTVQARSLLTERGRPSTRTLTALQGTNLVFLKNNTFDDTSTQEETCLTPQAGLGSRGHMTPAECPRLVPRHLSPPEGQGGRAVAVLLLGLVTQGCAWRTGQLRGKPEMAKTAPLAARSPRALCCGA